MQIKLVRSESEWDELGPSWDQLLPNSHINTPFQLFDFQRSWWQYKGGGEWPDGQLFILTGYGDSGELEGLAPLFVDEDSNGKTLRFIGSHEIADFLDFICPADKLEGFISSSLKFLIEEAGADWDSIDFCNMLENSESLFILKNVARELDLNFDSRNIQASPFITIPRSFDEYLDSLESKNGHELRRKLRRAGRYPLPIKLEIIDDAENAEAALSDFFSLMENVEDKALFLQGDMRAQMQAIAETAIKNGWGHVAFLKSGNDRIAGYLNFDYGNRIWAYNSGYEPAMNELSPGWLLTSKLIEWCIEEGKEVFDFMRGDEEYKYRFGSKDRFVVQCMLSK